MVELYCGDDVSWKGEDKDSVGNRRLARAAPCPAQLRAPSALRPRRDRHGSVFLLATTTLATALWSRVVVELDPRGMPAPCPGLHASVPARENLHLHVVAVPSARMPSWLAWHSTARHSMARHGTLLSWPRKPTLPVQVKQLIARAWRGLSATQHPAPHPGTCPQHPCEGWASPLPSSSAPSLPSSAARWLESPVEEGADG